MQDCVLMTGGAGFIGSNFVRRWLELESGKIVNLDALTYAGNLKNLAGLKGDRSHTFVRGNINDFELVRSLLQEHQPSAIVHFAAESHVDRSIVRPEEFIRTNVNGTFHLLHESLRYWSTLSALDQRRFRFLHVSTDEVFGSLRKEDRPVMESSPYAPSSPYAASKAAADHLVRAYHHTYELPTLITNSSNNYGPYQFPEKLVPLVITNALLGMPLPVYGDGLNTRDWLYVEDHCDAIRTVLRSGQIGETYNIAGRNEKTNLEVVQTICLILDEMLPGSPFAPHESLITFVKDRPGHDRRYAMDASKLERECGWLPKETFISGLRKTVRWYLDNPDWVKEVTSGEYQDWLRTHWVSQSLSQG